MNATGDDVPVAVRAVFEGRVQGVGFRAFVAETAFRLGVEGWVRNCSDGSVEAVLCGRMETIDAALERCRKGPPGAHVDALERRPAEQGEIALRHAGEDFSVLPTL